VGDVLFPAERDALSGRFHRTVADLVRDCIASIVPSAPRVCDVGGGIGRFLYELSRRGIGDAELVLVEPAGPLCEWARLLYGAPFDGQAPMVSAVDTVEWRPVASGNLPDPIPAVDIREQTAAEVAGCDGRFDLVSCLNVIDRVAEPARLVADLSRLLRPGGVLVLASPFHFRGDPTPRGMWLRDLREVLPAAHWSVVADEPGTRTSCGSTTGAGCPSPARSSSRSSTEPRTVTRSEGTRAAGSTRRCRRGRTRRGSDQAGFRLVQGHSLVPPPRF
jgi:SAM-dependent methyltransferase